ncbi:5-methylcytosine-specific restriction endonuclease system specificity protein McrC [Planococcus wigleyi]|uniref:5-methylcytosine-specific restriction endonuclease system specificity protein McrC n=1 Tax=Planococcus wigleyi TaxID=2762216 RepID=A0ABR8WB39_9BACL|nr:5-methylcytosine-specific restriction endonuclease system specificity protein McrC [Planococcus wigleyi]MBD8014219.1 5-methylcytosine-specific restriction endonuclease system specificity protein McrC [Planococcus wigleyi]
MIQIKNIYYMLSYAYRILREEGYKSVEGEDFSNIHDLFAAILVQGVANQCKRGLHKDYVSQTQTLKSLRGKIDLTTSLKESTLVKKSMVCHYDEFSENILHNQIIKTTMNLLVGNKKVKVEHRKELRKLFLYFQNVDMIEPHSIEWKAVSYHRNNATYQMLINICQLVINGLLMNPENGDFKMKEYLDDQQMHQLYEKFLLNYFKKEFPEYSASAAYIDWNIDDGGKEFLPAMKTDITLSKGGKTLIIDAKYYGSSMQFNSLYNSRTLISANLYQMFAYVKNRDQSGSGDVSGLILYAKTDEEITPDQDYRMSGNRMVVRTLNLGAEWSEIVGELNRIPLLMN